MTGKRVKIAVAITLFILMVGVLAHQLYYRPYQALDLKDQLAQYENLNSELARVQEENLKLITDIRKLKTDKKYVEQLLRERGYIYPDEELHILPSQAISPDEVD